MAEQLEIFRPTHHESILPSTEERKAGRRVRFASEQKETANIERKEPIEVVIEAIRGGELLESVVMQSFPALLPLIRQLRLWIWKTENTKSKKKQSDGRFEPTTLGGKQARRERITTQAKGKRESRQKQTELKIDAAACFIFAPSAVLPGMEAIRTMNSIIWRAVESRPTNNWLARMPIYWFYKFKFYSGILAMVVWHNFIVWIL